MMQFSRAVASLVFFVAASAYAQARNIPQPAKGGASNPPQEMIVAGNGVAVRLAPGVQIRDQNNLLIVPTAVPPGSQVKYMLDQERSEEHTSELQSPYVIS